MKSVDCEHESQGLGIRLTVTTHCHVSQLEDRFGAGVLIRLSLQGMLHIAQVDMGV